MHTSKIFSPDLFSVNEQNFDVIALQLFHFQAENNPLYKEYITHLGINPHSVVTVSDIPFLPISFFKNHTLKTGDWSPEVDFASSGTTGQLTSIHSVRSLSFYLEHTAVCFEHFFGKINDYHFLALLPSYLERSHSSLVAMLNYFIEKSESSFSGFYLNNTAELVRDLESLKGSAKKTMLWGVTFALLDFSERYHPDLSHCMVMETGGMKGRRKEITRNQLHSCLSAGFNVECIHAEYGMTELLSQAYSKGKNTFHCPPSMKILAREIADPMHKGLLNETGGINVIDLANLNTVSFIETEDIGKVYADGSFEVMGRLDNSDIRGCNLMVE